MASKKETKRINKVNDGDVFIIPISNGNYGMGQVIRRGESRPYVDAWLCLFDKKFTQTEIDDFKNIDITGLPILSVMPLNLVFIREKDWPIVGNRPVVSIHLPMFQFFNMGSNCHVIHNLERTILRNNYTPVESSMVNGFSQGPIYFTDLCELRWGNPDMVNPHATRGKWTWDTYYYRWPENCPTEEDMVINAHLYRKWGTKPE